MRKNAKIIELSGLFGMIFMGFCAVCLVAGFVVFPGSVAKYIWNLAAGFSGVLPRINLVQGVLLWAIAAISIYMVCGTDPFLSVRKATELDEDEMRELMTRIKEHQNLRKVNMRIVNPDEIKPKEKFVNNNSKPVEDEKDKENL